MHTSAIAALYIQKILYQPMFINNMTRELFFGLEEVYRLIPEGFEQEIYSVSLKFSFFFGEALKRVTSR